MHVSDTPSGPDRSKDRSRGIQERPRLESVADWPAASDPGPQLTTSSDYMYPGPPALTFVLPCLGVKKPRRGVGEGCGKRKA